ncbi:hypothetical protein [Aquipuribacter hungaricus]|uniref:Uncharacterized protein n=1 Tax=Aquipuribacter hungaricus TaxID=545624 RepID=A0ABV7WC48_9MICO
MMRTVTAAAALVGAVAVATAVVAAPASAVPNRRGNTEIVPNATLQSLLVSVDAPVTPGDAGGVEFGIVGQPTSGVVRHVGGITISTLTGGQLELRNFWIDTGAGTVSAYVGGVGRLELFELDGLTLELNATASTAIAGDASLVGAPVAEAVVDEWNF